MGGAKVRDEHGASPDLNSSEGTVPRVTEYESVVHVDRRVAKAVRSFALDWQRVCDVRHRSGHAASHRPVHSRNLPDRGRVCSAAHHDLDRRGTGQRRPQDRKCGGRRC